ncbi:MAG: protein kinase, partial [Deltaproteobacteria bacterium]|nr:protein kinase [Deltaproteobacteria bacterium]
MADIYLAGWLGPERQPHLVAVKELMPRLAARHRFSDMFVAEAELVSRLDHPNITRVEELGRWAGVPHIVMELVEGIDLSTLLRQCCLREL